MALVVWPVRGSLSEGVFMRKTSKWLIWAMLLTVAQAGFATVAHAQIPIFSALAAIADKPSICVNLTDGCHVIDGAVDFTVDLGLSINSITGAQISLQYDPTVLKFVSISPGGTCDPSSPFNLSVAQTVNELSGTILYAVGVLPLNANSGTQGPAALACLRFQLKSNISSELCLQQGINPATTKLSDQFGTSIVVDNSSDCPAAQPLPILSCATITPTTGCTCPTGVPDCSPLDTDCSTGVCNSVLGYCEALAINEGLTCDDGSTCTTTDTCVGGFCRGTGCPNPSVCLISQPECDQFTGNGVIRITLGQGTPTIIGGQFVFEYDPTTLNFISIEPGVACDPTSPFVLEFFKSVDQINGRIGYAVAISPSSPSSGTQGPATLACLTLAVRSLDNEDICIISGTNPLLTMLVDDQANNIPIDNSVDCPPDNYPDKIGCGPPCQLVPAVSTWGMIVLALLLLTASKINTRRTGVT